MLYTDRCFMRSVLYADGYLMAYLPGHFTHLLNVDVDLDLSHHIMYRGMLCYCSVCTCIYTVAAPRGGLGGLQPP